MSSDKTCLRLRRSFRLPPKMAIMRMLESSSLSLHVECEQREEKVLSATENVPCRPLV